MNPKIIALGLAAGRHLAKNNPVSDVSNCVDNAVSGTIDNIFGGGNKVQHIHVGKQNSESWFGDKESEDTDKKSDSFWGCESEDTDTQASDSWFGGESDEPKKEEKGWFD